MGDMADYLLENFDAPCEFCGKMHLTEDEIEECENEMNDAGPEPEGKNK